VTEGLPWGSPGTSSKTGGAPHSGAGGRVTRRGTLLGEPESGLSLGLWDDGEWVLAQPGPQDLADGEPLGPPSSRAPSGSAESGAETATAPPYVSRRTLRETRTPPGAAPEPDGAGWPPTAQPGPALAPDGRTRVWSTAELELYRAPSGEPSAAAGHPVALGTAEADARFPVAVRPPGTIHGHRLRRFVERWSRWVAGLGLPPRDPRGGRRYVERLLPPAVWLIAALGVAVFAGLLTGVLVSSPGAGAGNVNTAVATTTVTVTNEQTTTATATVTRTRTHTVTATPQVQPTAQNGPPAGPSPAPNGQNAGRGLGPGSQGAQVLLLQQALARLGLFAGPPTGVYDAQTLAAVQNFQARAGVTADPPGVAGPATLQALRQAVGQ
jgi:Putative peptidoglycan binding domain